jgi:hypothetical protein
MADDGQEKHAGGRPTKLTAEARNKILGAVSSGATREVAAQAAGIHSDTLRRWERKAEEGDELYAEFFGAVKDAEGLAEVIMVGRVQKASLDPKFWTAAAWWLERKHSDRWGKKEQLALTGEGGGPVRYEDGNSPLLRAALENPKAAKAMADLTEAMLGEDNTDDEGTGS